MIFDLTKEDKNQLKRLNDNKPVISALQKLFLNAATKTKLPPDVNVLAAERIAINIIQDAFNQLKAIQLDNSKSSVEENLF